MATVREVIEQAYTKVNGEYELLAETSDDFKTYLTVLNATMQIWAETPYVRWQSLFNPDYTLPTTVAIGKLDYPIPDFNRIQVANSPFDAIYFVNGNSVVKKYKMLDQAQFQAGRASSTAMLAGDTLYLKTVVPEITGTHIQLPVYMYPPQYISAQEEVMIDSIPWLIAYMAATICDASPVPFIARNADKYYAQADNLMKTMRRNNRHRQILSIKSVGDKRFTSLSAAIDAGVGVGGGSFDGINGGQF